jgi:hypothetical protein
MQQTEVRAVGKLRFVVFAAAALRLGVVRTHPDSPDPELAREAKPLAFAEVEAQWPDTVAALNGPWAGWGREGRPPGGDYRQAHSMRLEAAYRDQHAGLEVPSLEPDVRSPGAPGARGGLTIGVRADGTAFAAKGWAPADAVVAVQLVKPLVVDRQPAPGLADGNWKEPNNRVAMLLLADGRLAIGGGQAESTKTFVEQVQSFGDVVWAGASDGGGSFHVLHEDAGGQLKLLHSAVPAGRPTPSWIRVVDLTPSPPSHVTPVPSTLPPPPPAPAREPGTIIPRIYPQIYLDALHGGDSELAGHLKTLQKLGLDPVLHGSPRGLERRAVHLIQLCHDAGVNPAFSWGLDGTQDSDGTKLTAREKGLAIGHVLSLPTVRFGLLDAEGKHDRGGQDPEGTTEAGALELGRALREQAPEAPVGDQPWPWILSHGDVRRSAKPMGDGGVFAGFPVDEFALVANAGRYRQDYYLDWAPDAYLRVSARMDVDWVPVQAALKPLGLDRKLGVTLQGYHHGAKPHHLAHAILRYGVGPAMALFIWAEPFPEALVLAVVQAVMLLQREGFAPAGCDPLEAVRAWQRDYNRRAPENKKIAEDGWLGYEALRAMGLWAA